jgi:hypothetical protein
MTGSENAGGTSFSEEIYSFRRITLAPVILLSGYALMVYAIMSVPRKMKEKNGQSRKGKI